MNNDQLRIQVAYTRIKDALDEVALIRNKDSMLINVQHTLYRLEDVLHQYIIPTKEGK